MNIKYWLLPWFSLVTWIPYYRLRLQCIGFYHLFAALSSITRVCNTYGNTKGYALACAVTKKRNYALACAMHMVHGTLQSTADTPATGWQSKAGAGEAWSSSLHESDQIEPGVVHSIPCISEDMRLGQQASALYASDPPACICMRPPTGWPNRPAAAWVLKVKRAGVTWQPLLVMLCQPPKLEFHGVWAGPL